MDHVEGGHERCPVPLARGKPDSQLQGVFDLGIAASYLRRAGHDALALIRPLVAGYHAVAPLGPAEVDALFDLVRARLATSITLLYWRLRDRPESDDYRRKSLQTESNASHFLTALDSIGREKFIREISRLLEPSP